MTKWRTCSPVQARRRSRTRRRPRRPDPRTPRARWRPGPRSSASSRTPASAATVSKSRPIEEVRGELTLLLDHLRDAGAPRRRRAASGAAAAPGCSSSAGSSASSVPRAMRAGRRIAPMPPGSGTWAQMSDALEARPVGDEYLAAPERAVAAVARAVEGDPDDRLADAVLGGDAHDVRVMVLHADLGQVDARARTWWRGTRGAGRRRRAPA